jgi:pimeloyl-ACP methyl ester carboxylesterase
VTGATEPRLAGLEERWATVRGARVRYFVGGDGPSLVLVHGLGGAASNWVELAPALTGSHRVLALDLPGHGGSSPLPAASSLTPLADVVAAVAEREGLLPACVVGHSFGGLVGLRLALRRPETVRALLLASAAGISSGTRAREAAVTTLVVARPARLVAPFRRLVARIEWLRYPVFGFFLVSDPAALSAAAVEGFLAGPALHTDVLSAGRALVADDPRIDLGALRYPCLVLAGARDRMVPVADAVEYARRLRAPLRLVPDCGHLVIGERPDACAEAIAELLDRASPPAPPAPGA